MLLFIDSAQAIASLQENRSVPLSADAVEGVLGYLEVQQQPYLITYYPEQNSREEHWLVQLPETTGQYKMKEPTAPTVEAALTQWLLQRWTVTDEETAVLLAEGLCAMGLAYLCLFHPESAGNRPHFEFRKPEYQGPLLF
ncbi:hypothetical protein GJ688_07990 [Heliobacillus mobilis]|uniref:Uncharacterized protein n=1 Tax=Heliobacterium mobile TaxID=28064 RepID=A0A6I3SJM0_HELMO|nr:hypothetical protein [Heliobacterium mobile]MTV48922.1 hypothetical protein [Heliobacterium mobile]